MKKSIYAIITAILIAVCIFTGCENEEEEEIVATPDEAVAASATYAEDQTTTQAGSTAESTSPSETQPTTAKDQKTTKPKTDATQPTTRKPVQANIPKDTITNNNINPNLAGIRDRMGKEINERSIRTISLNYRNITIKVGEKARLKLSYDPENAVPKTCSVSSNNKCVQVSLSNSIVTVVGKSEGTAQITVKSYNGATTHCVVTVKKPQQGGGGGTPAAITDDTVLTHAKVCTRSNADRWRAAVDEYCAAAGMKKNTSLSGGTVTVSTGDFTSNGSFNSYKNQIVNSASSQIDTYTGKKYSDYEYNCVLIPEDSEFKIVVTLNKTEE